MTMICYIDKKFSAGSLAIIDQANEIIEDYASQGYSLTLRQLYYQFVSRDLIENKQSEYKRLGSIINDGRMAGLINWESIEDRTRNLKSRAHWDSPTEIMESALNSYHIDMWANQEYRPEVWIEKDALVGVIEDVCNKYDVPFFSCRGYTSQSEMWQASQRYHDTLGSSQVPMIIHLGDHDPSGIDMTRDIADRLSLFLGFDAKFPVVRIALNGDQIQKYNPPPNPAKITDSRASGYICEYGRKSWELDALEPSVISNLIAHTINSYRDDEAWSKQEAKKSMGKHKIAQMIGGLHE